MGYIYAILASLGQGIGYTFLKRSFEELPSSVTFFFEMLFGLIIWIPYSLIIGIDLTNITGVFLIALISAILSEAFVFYALSKGDVSITGTVFSIYPVFTVIFGRYLYGEYITTEQAILIFVIMIGVGVLSLSDDVKVKGFKLKASVLFPLLAALAVGVSDNLSKQVLDNTTSSTFLFCLALAQVPISIGYILLERQVERAKEVTMNILSYRSVIYSSICIATSMIFFWLAFENTLASIASPLTSTQMIYVLILSRIFLKEIPKKRDLIGLLITIVGVIGLSLVSI